MQNAMAFVHSAATERHANLNTEVVQAIIACIKSASLRKRYTFSKVKKITKTPQKQHTCLNQNMS